MYGQVVYWADYQCTLTAVHYSVFACTHGEYCTMDARKWAYHTQ